MLRSKEFSSSMRHSRRRAESLTSRRFYESGAVDKKLISLIEIAGSDEPKKQKTEQSRHLPYLAWFVIAKCNGIPVKKGEKPLFGTVIHILTFASAITYAVSYCWFEVYDIISINTQRDIPGGTIGIFLVFCWCAFGFYCKSLCSRLFLHQRFLKDVRVHSRTVFKISATLLALIFGVTFTASHVYEETKMLDPEVCEQIQLDYIVCAACSVSSIVFTFFTLIWHSLASFVFISVCRTHTIGLRCFIREIEYDSAMFRHCHSSLYKQIPSVIEEDDSTDAELMNDDENNTIQDSAASSAGKQNYEREREADPYASQSYNMEQQPGEISVLLSPVSDNLNLSGNFCGSGEDNRNFLESVSSETVQKSGESVSKVADTLSCSEILHNYWKLNHRLRFSSAALQRWFASFIALVLLRCSTYLVHWLTHTATVMDILQFAVPLVYLIVLSSAIAEVNFEGQRFQRSLYPTEERLKIFQFLGQNPLQMPIYGFGVTHGTIVTVVFAILVGFITRIVITELTK